MRPARGAAQADRREALNLRPVLRAIAHVESRGQRGAVSRRGALGVYQLMPSIAAWCSADPLVTAEARRCAARLLRLNLRRFGRLDVALAAYVFGAGNVRRYEAERLPWPPAVSAYVAAVLQRAGVAPRADALESALASRGR